MGPDAEFRAALARGRFLVQRGRTSGRAVFPPRIVEPGSGDELEWFEASGLGTLYSTSIVRKRSPESDYNVVLVELEEGPRLMSRVTGIGSDEVRIGMVVKAAIDTSGDDPVLVFEPA
ncbi:MAG: OB-fold domain-containing protein [Sphingomicrobium sp.]